MMKHHAKLATALGALVVLPLIGQESDRALYQSALGEVIGSLDVLQRVSRQLEADPEGAKDLMLEVTEPQVLPDNELDGRVDTLRREVSLLQMEFDARLSSPEETVHLPKSTPPSMGAKSGIPESLRATIRNRLHGDIPAMDPMGSKSPAMAGPGQDPVAEAPATVSTYSADPVGQARASFYAQRFEEALRLTEGLEDPAAQYIRSRCLTRLERFDDAIALMESFLARDSDSYEGRRIAMDIEFVRWKRDFVETLPKGMRGTEKP